jgi:hypothetical protein
MANRNFNSLVSKIAIIDTSHENTGWTSYQDFGPAGLVIKILDQGKSRFKYYIGPLQRVTAHGSPYAHFKAL